MKRVNPTAEQIAIIALIVLLILVFMPDERGKPSEAAQDLEKVMGYKPHLNK